jgi:molybdopterin converting factor small subunit
MIITEEFINNRYKKNNLVNNPNNSAYITICKKINYQIIIPYFSIIIPVHNQENIIIENLVSILNNTTEISVIPPISGG